MKKILSLLALMMLTMTSAWAGEVATFDLSKSPGTSTPSGFFTHEAASAAGKWNWNSKFNGAEYDGISFSQGLKMEGATAIDFTTTEVSTVTIVQSTWSANTIKFDGEDLAVADAVEGTGCRIYTVKDVVAGDHVIGRGSGESGLFYVKVEWDAVKTVTFINDAQWEKVNVYAWDASNQPLAGEWPGTELTATADGSYTWSTTANPVGIIFNNGSTQTDDLEFKNGGVYNSTGRVITKSDFTATFKTDGMNEVWAYAWNDSEKPLGDWPGTKMEGGNGEFTIAIQAEDAPKYIIFHNNAGEQTSDLTFEDGKVYEFMLNEYTVTFTTDAGWTDVYAWAWTETGEYKKNFSESWPGEKLEGTDGVYTYSVKSFEAPHNIQFNNGSDEGKTADLAFVDGKAYKWITATPYYALKEGDTFAAGTTVDLGDATITYGVQDGAEFGAAYAAVNEDYAGFTYMTGGNGENGSADGGTVYTIVPKYDGTITVGVRLNGGKSFFIQEDGESMEGYNGITIKDAANTSYSFPVKAGSTYKVYCTGSKLGFFGFDYKFTVPEVSITAVALMGSSNEWAEPLATFEPAAEAASTGYWTLSDVEFAANDEFKVYVSYSDGTEKWLAPASNDKFLVNEEQLKNELDLLENTGNMYVEKAAKLSFSLNPGLDKLTITGQFEGQPVENTYTVYFENTGNWSKVFAYAWYAASGDETGLAQILGTWPGREMTPDAETGKYTISFTSSVEPTGIIFNNGVEGEGAIQTADLEFENGKTYKYEAPQPAVPTIPNGTYYVMNVLEGLLFSTNGLDKEGAPLTFTFDETTGKYNVTGTDYFATAQWAVEGDSYFTISKEENGEKLYMTIVSDNDGLIPAVKTAVEDASYWIFLPANYWEDEVLSYNIAGTADLCGTEWDVTANKMIKNIETGVYEWKAENIIVSDIIKPEFKVTVNNTVDEETVAWYPEGDNWIINTDITGGEGVFDVTITFNNVTKEITVSAEKTGEIPSQTYTAYFENTGNWAEVYAYAWYVAPEGQTGMAIITENWPGNKMEEDAETGKLVVSFESKLKPSYIIFNNGVEGDGAIQTGDLVFEDGKTYSYEIPAEDIYVLVSDGDIAAALADAKAKVAKVGDIIIELNKESNAVFTISSTLTAPNSITFWGNDQKIDASGLEAPFIAMENVENPQDWTVCDVVISGVKVTGLKQPLFFSTCKNYLINDFNVSWVNCELAGDATTFDFTKGSVAVNFNVVHSTFYAPTATTKSFYSSQGGQKATEAGDYTQTFTFTNNTMYNLAPTKNFFSHRQSNQTWLAYDVQNNIFVNCGKSGQVIKGMNGGQSGKNPTWTIIGNAFNFDGADTSAAEETGDDNEPVQNSVAGVVTFVDAANGDFNGEIQLAEGAEYPAAIPGAPMWNINIKLAPVAAGFYLVGTMNDWTPSSEFMMAPNDAAQPEDPEYAITLDLEAGAQFKVISVDENQNWTWYPGAGFADCSVNDAGNYTIYCRPNGNAEWTWTYVYAQYNGEPTGINGIYAEKLNNATIYNLNGQRVQNAQKGLYIINGRKAVVK